MSPATLFALAANAALPAVTAYKYAEFALAPDRYDDEYSLALATLMIAQIPLVLLGAAFAGVSYIEGPAWRRVLVYAIVVAVIGAVSGLAKMVWQTELGLVIGWAIAMQLVIIALAGPQPEIARARIDAMSSDAANLTILAPFAGLIAALAAVALQPHLAKLSDWKTFTFEWSDLAWIGAAYFAMRTWSAIYVFTPAFEARRKGCFQRAWIERLVTPSPKGEP